MVCHLVSKWKLLLALKRGACVCVCVCCFLTVIELHELKSHNFSFKVLARRGCQPGEAGGESANTHSQQTQWPVVCFKYLIVLKLNVQLFLIRDCVLKYIFVCLLVFYCGTKLVARIVKNHWYWYQLLNFWYDNNPTLHVISIFIGCLTLIPCYGSTFAFCSLLKAFSF